MTSAKCHTFPKAEKLKSRKQIDLLFREGKSFFAAPVKCYYRMESQADGKTLSSEDENVLLKPVPDPIPGGLAGEILLDPKMILSGHGGLNMESPIGGISADERLLSEPLSLRAFVAEKKIEDLKVGFSVSKRNFKKATDRNRIKRLLREAWRLHKQKLTEQLRQSDKRLEVFLVFTDKSLPAFELVEDKIKYCLRRLGKLVEEGS